MRGQLEALARNWALVAIVSTVVILLVIPAMVLKRYVNIALNIMRTTKPPLARNPVDFERIVGEPVTFPSYDGLPLHGMLIRADRHTPRRGMVIFAHEFCADMFSVARYCRGLSTHGYDVLTFDFRGHGQSDCPPDYTPRQWVTNLELDDMRGATAFAERWLEEHGYPTELGLFGISRGGGAAILIAAEDPRVRAIVCDGAFSTDTTMEYLLRRWGYIFAKVRFVYENHPPVFWRFLRWSLLRVASREFQCRFPSVRKALRRMPPRPMLFIHGEKDSYIPVEQSRRLYAMAGQPKLLWIAKGAKHNQAVILDGDFYAELTCGFFDRYLARVGTAAAALVEGGDISRCEAEPPHSEERVELATVNGSNGQPR